MRKIRLEEPEANSLISELRKTDLIMLTGSTIASWEPTCLFSGRQFIDEMFELLFPRDFLDIDSEEGKILKKFFERVPFEHLLERFPNRDKLTSVLSEVFSINVFNPIHEIIAKAIVDSRIKALITTNYDLCLDELFKRSHDPKILKVITENDIDKDDINHKKVYFKIHGSADNPSSLVFTLTHESILPKWKREVLYKILNEKVLIIIGYSGADFEICPVVEQIPLKQIVWNTLTDKFPSYNCKRLLEQKSGVQLVGDMKKVLSVLFDEKICSSFNPKSDKIDFVKSRLTKCEIMEWRASLLNSIGLPSLSLKASERLISSLSNNTSVAYIRAIRQKAQSLFHLGKYKNAASLFNKAALMAKKINNEYLEADLLLDVSSSLRSYGALFRSYHYIKIVLRTAKKIKDEEKKNRLLGKIFLRKILVLRLFQQVTKRMKLHFLTQWINGKAQEYLLQSASLSLKTGNWFDFYQTRLVGDSMEIPINTANSDKLYVPPPTKDAYIQLGYYIPISIHVREQFKRDRGALTQEEETILFDFLKTAKSVKNTPEIWKIAWLGIKRDRRWRRNTEIWKDFFHAFFSCQYTIGMRIFILFGG